MTLVEFREHILIRLGKPVINIEIASDQQDICIDDAVKKFIEVHYDGLDEGYVFLDLVADTQVYELPTYIHSVLELVTMNSSMSVDEPLLVNPYLVGNYTTGASGSVLDIEMYNQNIALYKSVSKTSILFEFNSTTHELKVLKPPTTDLKVALKVHSSPADITEIYENTWVKKYSTALCKIAWANNISKFEGGTLPGGVSLNFTQILSEGKEEKELLETELYERYQEPCDFFFSWGGKYN